MYANKSEKFMLNGLISYQPIINKTDEQQNIK